MYMYIYVFHMMCEMRDAHPTYGNFHGQPDERLSSSYCNGCREWLDVCIHGLGKQNWSTPKGHPLVNIYSGIYQSVYANIYKYISDDNLDNLAPHLKNPIGASKLNVCVICAAILALLISTRAY